MLPGNATVGVVRVADTVRRPAGPWSDAVDAFLAHLIAVGFEGEPKPLGRDEQGRQVLEFVPGTTGSPRPTYSLAELGEIGRVLRDLHTASASFIAPVAATWNRVIEPDREELICHNDPAPWNLVRAPDRWVLIDWDFAGPGSRLWDLAYCAQTSVPLNADAEVANAARRLRALVDGYDLDESGRSDLVGMLARRTHAMHQMLQQQAAEGREPWSRIWIENGPYWRETTEYLTTHLETWTHALL